ncbi:MAG: hypothetical protein IJ608_04285 [Lachnospiraceae bacterium]|nr:hypothetical protein [Lachnospiraceae bacterium]
MVDNTNKVKSKTEEIIKQLEAGIEELFEGKRYKKYLDTLSKFHSYSFNNCLLIAMQMPEASYIAGYRDWQIKFKRNVKKGEHGISILAPNPYKKKVLRDVIDENGEKVKNAEGRILKTEEEINLMSFRPVKVFDISQTEGEELPSICVDELSGEVDGYTEFISALEDISIVPVERGKIKGGAKGFYSPSDKKIVLKDNISPMQEIKTLIHEEAHSMLHDTDGVHIEGVEDIQKDRRTKEVEAESVAYTVCKHFDIDTSEYSFGYIAGWSSGKEVKELRASLNTIRLTADKMIDNIEKKLKEMHPERYKTKEADNKKETLKTTKTKKRRIKK